jgi:hypothetical protein
MGVERSYRGIYIRNNTLKLESPHVTAYPFKLKFFLVGAIGMRRDIDTP